VRSDPERLTNPVGEASPYVRLYSLTERSVDYYYTDYILIVRLQYIKESVVFLAVNIFSAVSVIVDFRQNL
jgi:hypothetical protein